MKKMLSCLLLVGLIFSVFPFGAMSAEKQEFLFYGILPAKFPKCFLTQPDVTVVGIKLREITIDIPGLEGIDRLNFVCTEYSGILPKNWPGATPGTIMMWNNKKTFWPIYVHIAIEERADLGVVYQQGYCVGFLKALTGSGVDLSWVKNNQDVPFYFRDREWTMTQLEKAISVVGMIRGLRIEKKPKAIQKNFRKILGVNNRDDHYGLTIFLVNLSKRDPDRYIELAKEAVCDFLKNLSQESEVQEKVPQKIKPDWKRLVSASR